MCPNIISRLVIALVFLFVKQVSFSQDTIDLKKYSNGKIKKIGISRGVDTIEFRSYYRNDQLKDSLWLYINGGTETGIGTGKKFYENGTIESITYHGSNWNEYKSISFWKNGKIRMVEERPTGLTKSYSKTGEQLSEIDRHKNKSCYLPKNYRYGMHLGEQYKSRIKTTRATLEMDNKKIKLVTGVFVSLKLNGEGRLFTHCIIDGFSKDSMYISKFHYNPLFDGHNSEDIVTYDSTFAVALSGLDVLFYSRHYGAKRYNAALACEIIGAEFLVGLAVALPFGIKAADATNQQQLAASFGAITILSFPMIYLGKHLFKTAVPEKYDMPRWKILVP